MTDQPRAYSPLAHYVGPFVVTGYDATTMRSVVVAGPFDRIEDALGRAMKNEAQQKYPLMVDKASAFSPTKPRRSLTPS